jgi:uncharacterized protein (TIGR02246 family)
MAGQTPDETMDQLVTAVNARDLEGALALYHPEGTFVPERGRLAIGIEAIRAAWTELFKSKPTLTIRHETVESDGLALYSTKWTLSVTGPDGSPVNMAGKGGVVLRRQPDGQWLIAIENPWTDIQGATLERARERRRDDTELSDLHDVFQQ